jgi:Tol biopolymer transport system component
VTVTLSPDLGTGKWDLYWTDLEATSTAQGVGWDLIARTGDANAAAGATFSHDGNTIVYTSESTDNGVLPANGDLEAIPWNNRAGGSATKLPGASDPTLNEFFPAYSPDDQVIAFTRYPSDGSIAYSNPLSEVFAIPAGGGSAVRLAANDPPACSGVTSPGITNSWPKWAPQAQTVGDKTYYWVAFSSSRATAPNLQLYVTAVVVENGTITTYPAFYMWNQPNDESNHTPAWDVFKLE